MKLANKTHNCDEHIHAVLFAYWVSVQSSKKNPFEMLYGAKPRLLMELDFPRASDVDPASEHDAAVERHMLTVSELFLKEQEKNCKT